MVARWRYLSRPPTRPSSVPLAIRHFRLGRLPFSLEGESPFVEALTDEFAPVRAREGAAADPLLRIIVADALPDIGDSVQMPPITVLPDGFAHVAGRVRYQVRRDDAALRIHVHVPRTGFPRRIAPPGLQRFAHFNYLSHAERRVKSFVYDIFDYAAQEAQLGLGQTFVHASSLEREGKAVALLAWGGIGKTTSMLKLVLEDGWRFLSDDLGLVDADGMLHRSPKRMQVYGYNLRGQPAIEEAFLGQRSAVDRLSWAIFKVLKGNQRVRRRVSAEEMFGAAHVATSGQLTRAVFLERHSGTAFRRQDVAPRALAERCAAILLRELDSFMLVTCAAHGAGTNVVRTMGGLEVASRDLLEQVFSRVPCEVVGIPRGAAPDALVDFLRPILDERR